MSAGRGLRFALCLVAVALAAAAPAGAERARTPPATNVTSPAGVPAPPAALGAPEPRRARATEAPAITVLVRSTGDEGVTPTDTDNDYTRINDALQALTSVGDGTVFLLQGTFDWTEPFAAADWALGSDGLPASGDEFVILPRAGSRTSPSPPTPSARP